MTCFYHIPFERPHYNFVDYLYVQEDDGRYRTYITNTYGPDNITYNELDCITTIILTDLIRSTDNVQYINIDPVTLNVNCDFCINNKHILVCIYVSESRMHMINSKLHIDFRDYTYERLLEEIGAIIETIVP